MLSMQMEKESMQNRKPMILVLAGPNGSGKSTITAFFDKVGKYTNADDVVAAVLVGTVLGAVTKAFGAKRDYLLAAERR